MASPAIATVAFLQALQICFPERDACTGEINTPDDKIRIYTEEIMAYPTPRVACCLEITSYRETITAYREEMESLPDTMTSYSK